MTREADRDAIADLVFAYAERLDAGDLAGVASLFADATLRSAERAHVGAAAVLEVLRRRVVLHDGMPRTKHVTTNLVIEVDDAGGKATARAYFTVLQATPTLPLQVVIAGRYHDRFARAGTAWRFVERVVHVDLAGDLREHVRPA
jgi:3-phenylpropionate/cinnamic acid dioxygenase small subunit